MSFQAQISHSVTHSVSQSPAQHPRLAGPTIPLHHSLWACTAEISLGGVPAAAGEFLTKQLPPFLTSTAFYTAPLFNQSRNYPSQGPAQPISSLIQVSPGTPISLVPASTVLADVCCLCVSPTSSLLPPATSITQVPPGARLHSLLW